MTVSSCESKTLLKSANRTRAINYRLVVWLVCISIFLQYIMVFNNETGTEEVGEQFIMAALSLVTCFCYLLIAAICSNKISSKQVQLVIIGALYLAIRTIIAGNGIGYMFNNVEMLIAVSLFSSLKLPRKRVKQICIFSVLMFLLVFVTSRYDGDWVANRVFTGTRLNRNHFCVLTVINMYLALTALRKPDHKLHLTYWLVYVIGLLIIIPTTSRTSLICCALFIAFHILSVKKQRIKAKKLYKIFLLCMIVSILAVGFLAYVLPSLIGSDTLIFGRSILSGRNVIYVDAFETLFSDSSWIFGRGILADFTSTTSIYGTVRTNAHNQWLQMFLNYGIVYLIFVIYLYLYSFKRILRKGVSVSEVALVVMQILLFIYFTTEAVHFYRSYACLFLVIYFTNYKTKNEKQGEQTTSVKAV